MTSNIAVAFLLVTTAISGSNAFSSWSWSWPWSTGQSTDAEIERIGSAPWSLDQHLCGLYFTPPCYRHHELVYQWIAEVSMQDLPLAVSGEACKTNKTLCDRYARAMRQYHEKNVVKLERVMKDTVRVTYEEMKPKIAELLYAQLDLHHLKKVVPEFVTLGLIGTDAIERLKRIEVNTMTSWAAIIRGTLSRMGWNNWAGFISLCVLLETTRKKVRVGASDVRSGFLWSLTLMTLPWVGFAERLTELQGEQYDIIWIAARNVGLVAIQMLMLTCTGFSVLSWGDINVQLAEIQDEAKRKKRLNADTDYTLAEKEAKRERERLRQATDTAGRYDLPPVRIPAQRSQPGLSSQPDTMDGGGRSSNNSVVTQPPVKPEDGGSSLPLSALNFVWRGVKAAASKATASVQAPAQSPVVLPQASAPDLSPPLPSHQQNQQPSAASAVDEQFLKSAERMAYEKNKRFGHYVAQAASIAARNAAMAHLESTAASAASAAAEVVVPPVEPRRSSRLRKS